MKSRTELILWDAALVLGILLFAFCNISERYNLIVGFVTVLIFSFSIQKHIAAYKVNGKIY